MAQKQKGVAGAVIKAVNYAYDASHQLTKVTYRGREAVIATELGRLLDYTNNGSRLVQMITTRPKVTRSSGNPLLRGEETS
jgi:hypothetical protein